MRTTQKASDPSVTTVVAIMPASDNRLLMLRAYQEA